MGFGFRAEGPKRFELWNQKLQTEDQILGSIFGTILNYQTDLDVQC